MQLFSAAISPYAARCRIQIQYKQLPVEILAPPGGMGSTEIKAANPIGKIPVLKIDDECLAESWAIMEFIENSYPVPAMRPHSHLEAARQTALVRFVDLYLAPAMFPLFLALRGAADDAAVDQARSALNSQLDTLEQMLARLSQTEELSLADAALLPVIWYARVLARHFGMGEVLADRSACQAWWQRSSSVPAAAGVLEEMQTAFAAAMPALFE